MKALVVPTDYPSEQATQLALANGCAGFYTGVPPKWLDVSASQGWTLPCVVEEDADGNLVGWTPVDA